MRELVLVMVAGVLIAACSGVGDSTGDGTGANGGGAADVVDPCTLAGEDVLLAYFGDATVEGESGESGPIHNCTWRDDNANSLLVQIASEYSLNRPDPCDGCVDLPFGDEGYASESPLQSTAKWVAGTTWYSVTTTGFRDDADSITSLAQKIFNNATG
jgi:hypothetical protein